MHDLSGNWRGLYSYPVALDPVPFTARLDHAEEWLGGATAEAAAFGEAAGTIIAATLRGKAQGSHVTFLKTYDRESLHYDAVHYEGEVEPEGQEIWGRWTVPGSWSGTFLMIRATQTQAALSARWSERV